jgi:TonB family protein
MTAYALSDEFGVLASDSDRRFKRLLMSFGLPALILGILIPLVDLPSFVKQVITPQRYAKLIQAPLPKKEEKKPEPEVKKPELTHEQKVERARKRAEKQLASLRDSLADLREGNVITSSTANPSFAASAAKGSGGIGQIGVVERGSTTGLGSRTGTSVKSNIGKNAEHFGGERGKTGRTLDEIQLIFDRNKGAYYTMYVREQRQNPNMVGKLIVRMTIAPSGHVTKCSVVSSELGNPEFEKKVVARVMLMDFGAKDVGDFTLDYPILFFPS